MHREIVQRMRARRIRCDRVVDHRDRNRRNNTRANLRVVSVKTNNWNRSNILLWDGERWVYEPHGVADYASLRPIAALVRLQVTRKRRA